MSYMEKNLWSLSDYAQYLGTSLPRLSKIYKETPEKLAKPVPHPIGKKDRWNKEEVIKFYSATEL